MEQLLTLCGFIPTARFSKLHFFYPYRCAATAVVHATAQDKTTVTKQELHDNSGLKSESNQERFGALMPQKKVQLIAHPDHLEHTIGYIITKLCPSSL